MKSSVRSSNFLLSIIVFLFLGVYNFTNATVFTMLSPIGPLPSDVTQVGGIVFQAKGLSGAVVTSQLSASSLYQGFASSNPQQIGIQTGFTPAIRNVFGGGLSQIAVRITLFDGDTANGNFDFNGNFLQLNGFEQSGASNFSNVLTQETNNTGTLALRNPILGFDNNRLHTGFFSFTDSNFLGNVWNSMQGGSVAFSLRDISPFDNNYDFTRGINGSLFNVGQPPSVTSAVPEPTSLAVISLIPLFAAIRSRRTTNIKRVGDDSDR
ncbi:MAG: hypothetical protein LW720_14575 [Pirellula sp.]|jgi:hypothetical protein|nr:hypothetical protein [Pirellula sp.]